MTSLKRNVEFITFKNGCQGTVLIFTTERRFRKGGAFSQLRNEEGGLQNGTRVPRGGLTAAKPPAKMGLWLRKWDSQGFGDFAEHFTTAK